MCRIGLMAVMLVVGTGEPASAQWGSLKGKVVLDGAVPVIPPLFPKGMAPKDNAVCGANAIPDDSVQIDAQSKGIANVVVWLVKKPAKIHPALVKPAIAVVDFDQVQCRFTPRVIVLRTEQEVRLLNGDNVAHNTNFTPIKNQGFNPALAPNDRVGDKRKLKLPERAPCPVTCGIHPWMKGHWMIVDHPYAVVTDKDGIFEIKDLPAGDHEFKVWHENSGYLYKDPKDAKKGLLVTIPADQTLEVPAIKVVPETILPK